MDEWAYMSKEQQIHFIRKAIVLPCTLQFLNIFQFFHIAGIRSCANNDTHLIKTLLKI